MGKQRTTNNQAEIVQVPTDADVRARVWELHLRCVPNTRIGERLDLHRNTVAAIIKESYREVGADRAAEKKRKLDGAISRMRRIQEQAWTDHDADDERERSVLERAVPGTRYQSQRGQYLKVILDAEKEVARLEGLYEALSDDVGAVVFKFVREGSSSESSGATVTTAGYRGIAGRSGDNDPDSDGFTEL